MGVEEDTYSSIFLALKHPVRRRILWILNESPATYTQIMNGLGVESGFLNYHMDSLGPLIAKNEGGQYHISEFGKAALALITRVEAPLESIRRSKQKNVKVFGFKINPIYIMAAIMMVGLTIGAAIGMFVGPPATVVTTLPPTTVVTTATTTIVTTATTTANGDHRSIRSPTVIESPGTYVLSVDIEDSPEVACIRIISSDVILDGQGYAIDGTGAFGEYDTYGVYVHNPSTTLTNVTVKNLWVRDWGYGICYRNTANGCIATIQASSNWHGIRIHGSSNHTVINNTVNDGWIFLMDSHSNNVINNTVNAGGIELHGSTVHGSTDNNVTKNTVNNGQIVLHASRDNNVINNNVNAGGGIWLLFGSVSNNVINNTIKGPPSELAYQVGVGIGLWSSHNNTLINNTATFFEIGIRIAYVSSHNKLIGNNASWNEIAGIHLEEASRSTVTDNTVDSNGVGLMIEGSINLTVTRNKITSNKEYGISLDRSSSGNMIYDNYFDNEYNACDDGENTWNIAKTPGTNIVGGPFTGGNFWSDYTGIDSDGDGLGDTRLPCDSNGGIVHGGDFLPLLPIDR